MQHVSAAAGAALPFTDAPRDRPTSVRNAKRARAWREHLERVCGLHLSQARTAAAHDAIEAAHRAEVRWGPPWARIRRGSEYATPVCVKDRAVLDGYLGFFTRLEAALYVQDRKLAAERRKRIVLSIPRTARAVVMALVCLARKYRQVIPSLARLASMARCCRATVVHVLNILEDMGLVIRHRRRQVIEGPFGKKEAQATSCYQLARPDRVWLSSLGVREQPKAPEPKPLGRNDGQQLNVDRARRGKGVAVEATMPPTTTVGVPEVRPTASPDWKAQARAALERASSGLRRR